MTPEQQAAIARANAVLAKADATLERPRPSSPAWEGKAAPVVVRKTVVHAVQKVASSYVTAGQLQNTLRGIAKATAAVLRERDDKIADLEQRLVTLEAVIARAKGASQ